MLTRKVTIHGVKNGHILTCILRFTFAHRLRRKKNETTYYAVTFKEDEGLNLVYVVRKCNICNRPGLQCLFFEWRYQILINDELLSIISEILQDLPLWFEVQAGIVPSTKHRHFLPNRYLFNIHHHFPPHETFRGIVDNKTEIDIKFKYSKSLQCHYVPY